MPRHSIQADTVKGGAAEASGLQRRETSCYSMDEVDPSSLRQKIDRYRLPATLKARLFHDSLNGGKHYTYMTNIAQIDTLPPNTGYAGRTFGCVLGNRTMLVEAGNVGLYQCNDDFYFLGAGQHSYSAFGTDYFGQAPLNTVDKAIVNGPSGFITISEGHLGMLICGGEYRLLAPGSYQWNSSAVADVVSIDVTENTFRLGPYTVVSVPVGGVAVTTYHGEVRVLGAEQPWTSPGSAVAAGTVVDDPRAEAGSFGDGTTPPGLMLREDENRGPIAEKVSAAKSPAPEPGLQSSLIGASAPKFSDSPRTFFLDDVRWKFENFLSLKQQTDRLEGNDLLSKDNVEVLMVAMAHWQIVDPMKAVIGCATTMPGIKKNVDSIIRATIARIVAGTSLGHGGVSGAAPARAATASTAVGTVVRAAQPNTNTAADNEEEEADLAHVMISSAAAAHMTELRSHMERMGIEVLGIYIPEKRIKNSDTRMAVARQAVIGIHAEAQRAASDAEAYATMKKAAAQAEAIRLLGEAHEGAGEMLGDATTTQARLALSQAAGRSLQGAEVTLFSGCEGEAGGMKMPPLVMTAPAQ